MKRYPSRFVNILHVNLSILTSLISDAESRRAFRNPLSRAIDFAFSPYTDFKRLEYNTYSITYHSNARLEKVAFLKFVREKARLEGSTDLSFNMAEFYSWYDGGANSDVDAGPSKVIVGQLWAGFV